MRLWTKAIARPRASNWRPWLLRSTTPPRRWRDTGSMASAHVLSHFLRTLPDSAVAPFLAVFPIVHPFGRIPIFFTMTSTWTARERNHTALHARLWGFVIL